MHLQYQTSYHLAKNVLFRILLCFTVDEFGLVFGIRTIVIVKRVESGPHKA